MQRILLALLATAGAAAGLAAQSSRASVSYGAIQGGTVDSAGTALRAVEVMVMDEPRARAVTSAAGAYRIDSVPSGSHVLRFRRLGLRPVTLTIDIEPNDIADVDAVLEPMPHQLAPVKVQDAAGNTVFLPPDVAARMKSGQGAYLTSADVDRIRPVRTSELLHRIQGIDMTASGAAFNPRGIISVNGQGCKYGIAVFVDGARLTMDADSTLHASNLLDRINPRDIAAIEVYRGSAEVPANLPNSPCGGVFIWTKTQ